MISLFFMPEPIGKKVLMKSIIQEYGIHTNFGRDPLILDNNLDPIGLDFGAIT